MFTLAQIKEAHAKVKTGADYPAYVKEIMALGVTGYSTCLSDNRTEYYGENGYSVSSVGTGVTRRIAPQANIDQFKQRLLIHQQGQTDFPTFCNDAAKAGVYKWQLDFNAMTCTYYDTAGIIMVVEKIG